MKDAFIKNSNGRFLLSLGALILLLTALIYLGSANAEISEQQTSCVKPTNDLIDYSFGTQSRDIFFDYESDAIREDAKEVLASNADILKRNPEIMVVVEGYTDINETGGGLLAQSRAHNVRDFMISQGVEAGRILTSATCDRYDEISYDNDIPELDRRVHFISIGMEELNLA